MKAELLAHINNSLFLDVTAELI